MGCDGVSVALPIRMFSEDTEMVVWDDASINEVDPLLAAFHYLGPANGGRYVFAGFVSGSPVAAMVWRMPTSRYLPSDGTWLELSRWCLTAAAGPNAGSRMHAFAVKQLKRREPGLTTLVSYSDPSVGHTGALYRACNWIWAPTWHRLRPPPSGNGNWGSGPQSVKDRWVFHLRRDSRRAELLSVKDEALMRERV